MDQKTMQTALIVGGVLAGIGAMAGLGALVWNSKQLRTVRRVKQTGKILYGVGTALRTVSGVMSESLT